MSETFVDWLLEGYRVIFIWSLLIIFPALAIDSIINGFSMATGIAFTYISINLLIIIAAYLEANKNKEKEWK